MPKQRISRIETIRVKLDDPTRLLERATKQAIDIAVDRFGMDDSGYATKVKGWDRGECSIRVVFDGMEMHGGMTG